MNPNDLKAIYRYAEKKNLVPQLSTQSKIYFLKRGKRARLVVPLKVIRKET